MWIFLALLSALFFAIGQLFSKKGLSAISPLWMNLLAALSKFIIFTPIVLIRRGSFSLSPIVLILCIFFAVFNMSYYYALSKGTLSVSSTIISSYPLVTILLSVIFLHEALTILQILMIALIILGGILISLDPKKSDIFAHLTDPHILWPLIGAIAYGVVEFLAKIITNHTSADTFNFTIPIVSLLVCGVFFLFDKRGRKLPQTDSKRSWHESIWGTSIMALGVLCFNYSVSMGKASLVTSISSSYSALTIILAYFFLKERMSPRQTLGAILTILGVVGISI